MAHAASLSWPQHDLEKEVTGYCLLGSGPRNFQGMGKFHPTLTKTRTLPTLQLDSSKFGPMHES